MTHPSISVIIPVRDEERAIGRCLDSVLAGTVPPDEVLVLDGRSTDRTREIVEEHSRRDPRVRLIDNPERTIPAALNLGWRSATSDLVVRVDGHAVVAPTYLERCRDHLADGTWQGVGGRKVPVSTTRTGRVVAAAMSSRWGVGGSRYHYAEQAEEAEHVPFGAYPRAVIESLGGWDEELLVNQDFEFDHRLRASGGRILLDPEMWTRWSCSGSLRDLAHQYHRYGRGKAKVAIKHPRSLSARHVLPPLLPVGLAVLVLGSLSRVRLVATAARTLLAGYAAAMSSSALARPARELPAIDRLRFPVVVFVMHCWWGAGFLRGLVDHVGRRGAAPDPYRPRALDLPSDLADEG